jgi:hypothetical protein
MSRRIFIVGALGAISGVLGWLFGPLGLAVAAIGMSLLARCRPREAEQAVRERDELLAHLARARRRDEQADVMVVRASDGNPEALRGLQSAVRITDSTCLARHGGLVELRAMVDHVRLDRDALEVRLRLMAGQPLEIGWATFPDDGYTLPRLLETASSRCGVEPAQLQPKIAHSAVRAPARVAGE